MTQKHVLPLGCNFLNDFLVKVLSFSEGASLFSEGFFEFWYSLQHEWFVGGGLLPTRLLRTSLLFIDFWAKGAWPICLHNDSCVNKTWSRDKKREIP